MLQLLQTFTALPVFLGLLLVYVTITLLFCIGLLRASVQQLDRTLEEAPAVLASGRWGGLSGSCCRDCHRPLSRQEWLGCC